jgi:hypothetical protein
MGSSIPGLRIAGLGNGGPWKWRTLELADPGNGGPEPIVIVSEPTVFDRRFVYSLVAAACHHGQWRIQGGHRAMLPPKRPQIFFIPFLLYLYLLLIKFCINFSSNILIRFS